MQAQDLQLLMRNVEADHLADVAAVLCWPPRQLRVKLSWRHEPAISEVFQGFPGEILLSYP